MELFELASQFFKTKIVQKKETKMLENNLKQWLIYIYTYQFRLVEFSRSVVSNSLQHHESQPTRPPCPSPFPGVHSNSHPSSR